MIINTARLFFSLFFSIKIAQEVQYIKGSKERQRILKACHVGPTLGHMGVKRTTSYHSMIFLEGN